MVVCSFVNVDQRPILLYSPNYAKEPVPLTQIAKPSEFLEDQYEIDPKTGSKKKKKLRQRLIKFIYVALCLINIVLAIAVMVVTVLAAIAMKVITTDQSGRLVAMILLAVLAAVTLSITIYAMVAVLRKQLKPIYAASTTLLVLAFIQAIILGVGVKVTEGDELNLSRSLSESFQLSRDNDQRNLKLWAAIQHDLACCGLYGANDYRNPNLPVVFAPNVPISCCPGYDKDRTELVQERERQSCKAKKEYYDIGCKDPVIEIHRRTSNTAIAVVSSIIIVEIILSALVPPDFCFENFNRSDCKVAPQQVFSYYKPGSRCEKETWRGCPTLNKFESQAECVHLCIFHFGNEINGSKPTGNKKAANAVCLNPVNIKYCNDNLTKVFIYNKFLNTCVSIIWGGCPYPDNVFENKSDCLETCFRLDWNEKVKEIPETQTNEVEEILDNFIDGGTSVSTKSLYEFITTSTHNYDIETKTSVHTDDSKIWKNQTENMIIDIGTTQNVESQNEVPERKKNTTIATPKMLTSESISTIAEKVTESIPTMKESTAKTRESETKTTESTIETTELTTKLAESTTETSTTIIVEPATTTMLATMTTSGITTTRTRGTAKQVVLPQDIDR
ncbi:unnamed protein product, partial [Brenthis ino]